MELAEYRAMRDIDCLLGRAVGEGEVSGCLVDLYNGPWPDFLGSLYYILLVIEGRA